MKKQDFKLPKINIDDKIISRAYEEVIGDEECLGFIKKHDLPQEVIVDNLAIFLRLIKENTPCRNCPGIDKCQKDPKGYTTILYLGEDDIEVGYTKCLPALRKEQTLSDYYFYDFDEEWLDKRLDSVSLTPERNLVFYKLLGIIKDGKDKNYFIYSDRAVGKSYLAAIIANEVVFGLKRTAAFVNASVVMDRLRSTVIENKNEYENILTKLEDAYLLVIDDLGGEKVTELSIDILTRIVDFRLKNNKPTIITSNYSLNDLNQGYRNFQFKAKRLLTRLSSGYESFYLDGLDYRKMR